MTWEIDEKRPWEIVEVIGEIRRQVASVAGSDCSTAEQTRNLGLMARAPALLEACQEALPMIRHSCCCAPNCCKHGCEGCVVEKLILDAIGLAQSKT